MAVGPVDVYIIGFPATSSPGVSPRAIVELVENGTVRVLDLLFVMKDADGAVTSVKAADIDQEGAAFLSDRHRAAGCVGGRGRRRGQRRPPGQQLGPPGRIREPLGRGWPTPSRPRTLS